MARQRNELHTKQVAAWKNKNSGLTDKELSQLFINGILAVRHRTLATLSNVTVTVVVDRILLECQERFSILSEVTNDSEGLHFDKFSDKIHGFKPKTVQEALQELLLDLLEVFGKITADILTKNLHQELMTVTNQASNIDLAPLVAVPLSLARKNRDQK